MFQIFLIIFVFQYIEADNDNNEKYIDLLPEEEKQQFLNRIARRIFEEVKSSVTPNESQAEVNEEQLDAQNDYVKKIIKEESKMLQNEKSGVLRNDQEKNNRGDKNSDVERHIDLTFRTQRKEERNYSELNEQLHAKNELKVIPVINDQDNAESRDNKTMKSESSLNKQAIHDKDITTKLDKDKKDELVTTNDTNITANFNIERKSYDDEIYFGTTISNFDPYSEETTAATEDEIIFSDSTINPDYISNSNTTEIDDDIHWISTKKIYDESDENINSESTETTSSSTLTTIIDEEQVNTSLVTNFTLVTEENGLEITTLKTPENSSNSTQSRSRHNLNKHLYVRSGASFKNFTQPLHNDSDVIQLPHNDSYITQFTHNNSNVTQFLHNDSNVTQVVHNGSNVTELPNNDSNVTQLSHNASNVTQLTRHNELSDLKTNENDKDSVNKLLNDSISEINITNSNGSKSNASVIKSIYLVNNNKENIRKKTNTTELKLKDSHIPVKGSSASKESEIKTFEKPISKSEVKEYEVFEVAADKPPFEIKSNVETKDTPHYIPVYNYAPDNAYFRPRSQFGPNEDSNEDKNKNDKINNDSNKETKKLKTDSPIMRSIFSGYKRREKASYGNKPGRYLIKKPTGHVYNLPRPMKNHNFQNIYYNPNDYLDMDYYYARGGMKQLRNGNSDSESGEKWFPNTDEEDHPYNSIHSSDSIKSHIRAVRKLLYLKQIYEPIKEIKHKELRKFYHKRIQNQNDIKKYNGREKLRNTDLDNIASDYYFGVIPYSGEEQLLAFNKILKNKLLRNVKIKKTIERNAKYDQSNTTSIHKEPNTELDKMIESILDVLRDFIRFDNQALSKYNWLESTVDVLAAIEKLLELMTQLQFEEQIHPKDLELSKYILYLYKTSVNKLKKETPEEFNEEESIQLKKGVLPKNKWNNRIKEPLKLWKDVAYYIRSNHKKERMKLLYDFEDFLQKVLFYLHDFHDAIKHIAIITKYNNQKWFDDLKHIYLHSTGNEKLLTLLLHVSVTKLLNSIETSAKDGAENNFKDYIINNKQYVQRSKEEFLFVLNILHELRRINKKIL